MDRQCESGGYNPAFFTEIASLEAGHFWFRARADLLAWAVKKYCGEPRSLLDIGCGTGFVLARLRARQPRPLYVGTEFTPEGVRQARLGVRGNALVAQMDARALAFDGSFDVVGAFDVLEHIEEDVSVLAEARRALRSDGILLLTVPQHSWLWSQADVDAHHVRRYKASELLDKVDAAGFEVVLTTSFVSLLLPLMLAARRSHRPNDDALAELRISRLANVLLGSIMRFERFLIIHGVRFPAGGSRLVVARRRG